MELLTKEIRERLPELGTTDGQYGNAVVQAKFFDPTGSWTWYATEFDGKDEFFGLVDGFEVELGPFSLSELESVRGRFGLGIERDIHFQPRPLRELTCCPDWLKRGAGGD